MSDKKTMACPACQEGGSDKSGDHLAVFSSGKFSCAVHPGDRDHNRRILELMPELGSDKKRLIPRPSTAKVVDEYPYVDENNTELYRVRRHEPKGFSQGHYEGNIWVTSVKGIRRVPFNLPEVIKSETVWIVEGEKDAKNLIYLGYVATTRAGGSDKWEDEFTPWFRGKNIVLCGDNDPDGKGQKYMDKVAAALTPVAKTIKRVAVPSDWKDISEYLTGLSDTEARALIEELLYVPDPLDVLLNARRFDLINPPAKPVPVLMIGNSTIATAGNLVVLAAQAKAGKTAYETAMMASLMNPTGDCLGVTGYNPLGLPVIHFDTEQSRYDHHSVVLRTLQRAGIDRPPDWFRSYSLADVSTGDRRKALKHEMKRAAFGGKLGAVFLDGIADLCVDPNDSAEAFDLVGELHSLAITFDCPIINVLHENPNSEFGKTRGHLGSQLERKAETNLRIKKGEGGISTIFTERARHCHIPESDGPRFLWDSGAGMHVSYVTCRAERTDNRRFTLQALRHEVFNDCESIKWSDLLIKIMKIRQVKGPTAEKDIRDMDKAGFIKKNLIQEYVRGDQ